MSFCLSNAGEFFLELNSEGLHLRLKNKLSCVQRLFLCIYRDPISWDTRPLDHCISLSLEPGLIKHVSNREENSLRHVAMVAKFLDDNKRKRQLQSEFARL